MYSLLRNMFDLKHKNNLMVSMKVEKKKMKLNSAANCWVFLSSMFCAAESRMSCWRQAGRNRNLKAPAEAGIEHPPPRARQ